MKQTSLLALLTITLVSFGQHELGLKVSGGLSKISSSLEFPNPNHDVQFVFSGQGGLFYNFHVTNKSLIGTELLFSQIEGKESQFGPTDFWRHISYLALPVYFGYKIKNTTIHFGLQVSVELASSGKVETHFSNGQTSMFKFSNLSIDPYDFGPKGGICYDLSKKVSIEANYYIGLNNILRDDSSWIFNGFSAPGDQWHVRQMTVGIRYKFLKE